MTLKKVMKVAYREFTDIVKNAKVASLWRALVIQPIDVENKLCYNIKLQVNIHILAQLSLGWDYY